MSDEAVKLLITNLPAILTAFALLVGAIVTGITSIFFRKISAMQADVRKIEVATNSMKDALIVATDSSARAQGQLQGAADEQARVLSAVVQDVHVVNSTDSPVPTIVAEPKNEIR